MIAFRAGNPRPRKTHLPTDSLGHWCLCDNTDNAWSCIDGMAKRNRHERLHWELLLRCRYTSHLTIKAYYQIANGYEKGSVWSYQHSGSWSWATHTHTLYFLRLASSMVALVQSSHPYSACKPPMAMTPRATTMLLVSGCSVSDANISTFPN